MVNGQNGVLGSHAQYAVEGESEGGKFFWKKIQRTVDMHVHNYEQQKAYESFICLSLLLPSDQGSVIIRGNFLTSTPIQNADVNRSSEKQQIIVADLQMVEKIATLLMDKWSLAQTFHVASAKHT